jgi:hypothetical protein
MATAAAPGVPLAHYPQHCARVDLTCLDCVHHRSGKIQLVLAGIAKFEGARGMLSTIKNARDDLFHNGRRYYLSQDEDA